jgi:hypothetical protein
MIDTHRDRRQQIVVNKPLQSRVLRDFCWLPVTAMTGQILIVGLFATRILAEARAAEVKVDSVAPLVGISIAFLAVGTVALVVRALRLSNRIAGPQYRIKNVIEQAIAGESGARCNLRDGDYLDDLAPVVDSLIELNEQLRWAAPAQTTALGEAVAAAAVAEAATPPPTTPSTSPRTAEPPAARASAKPKSAGSGLASLKWSTSASQGAKSEDVDLEQGLDRFDLQ